MRRVTVGEVGVFVAAGFVVAAIVYRECDDGGKRETQLFLVDAAAQLCIGKRESVSYSDINMASVGLFYAEQFTHTERTVP